jgi:heme exporter protein D
MAEFLAMGGYAEFVWSTFGITLLVLIVLMVGARRRLQNALRDAGQRAIRQRKRES